MISGEPIPVEKGPGDTVIGGTVNGTGSFVMIATKVGNDTVLSQIVNMVAEAQRSRAESVLRAVGVTLWVEDEDALDAVTALSGSGPAYYFLLMELMEEAGHALGLPREAARMLTLQTAYGAARMALESDDAPAVLRARVSSPTCARIQASARWKASESPASMPSAAQASVVVLMFVGLAAVSPQPPSSF